LEDVVKIQTARAQRDACNQMLRAHTDPIEHRKRERAAAILTAHGTISFSDAIDQYLTAHRAEWTPKHFKAWRQTLTQYAVPELGRLLVSDITTAHVVRTLEPTWPAPTAISLRGRIEKVLDWCKVRGYRAGENPAAWKGTLDHLLANPSRRKIEHHRALSIDEMPRFMAALRKQQGPVARCLEFAILTAARADEARRATPARQQGLGCAALKDEGPQGTSRAVVRARGRDRRPRRRRLLVPRRASEHGRRHVDAPAP
jgi:integrase